MLSVSLQQVAAALLDGEPCGVIAPERIVSGVTATAEKVNPGDIFVAIKGFSHDGHALVDAAFERGAALCVVQDPEALKGRPGIKVANSRRALSRLAAMFYGEPSTKLKVVGITGTNGKTTTNWIVYHVLNTIGGGALRIGTLGTELMGRETEAGSLTSPDALSVQALMAKAVAAGAKGCVMEASSHALDQARVEDVAFDVGVFTNLTRDHLDYHKTFEAYFDAKSHLFDLVAHNKKPIRAAVINADDPYGVTMIEGLAARGIADLSFGRSERAAIRILDLSESAAGMEITLSMRGSVRTLKIEAPFIGLHNAENVTAAFGACVALGYAPEEVAAALRTTPQVPGRLERVGQGRKRVFVDYAHTPDALERVIAAVRPSTAGKLWVVFGCGGDRDRGKRPQMAKVAAQGADHVVVTSDNPRTEKPEAIIEDILREGISPTLVEVDRRRAITATLQQAAESDTVLIAGKGHEDYQITGTEKIYFSDQSVAREALGT
jgi:UDP-N-acetylmuramoyl-L-alanyl-D-glutamate--2,6-diaminopimelate ligase